MAVTEFEVKKLELEGPLLDQEGRPLALALIFSLLSAASRHILESFIPLGPLLMPPACSTAKGSTVVQCHVDARYHTWHVSLQGGACGHRWAGGIG